ncbi:MAG: peroxiredoxin [Gammaproteobacteria bacterium]
MLQAGQAAPDFVISDTDGTDVTLSAFRGDKNVVVYFYPKDDTPGCTIEAKNFTALRDRFDAADTVVLGVSRDDCASHAAFRDKYGLNVRLLADDDGRVSNQYGVWQERDKGGEKRMGIVRSTFIIDKTGTIRHALYGVKADGHAAHVLELVRDLG